MRESVNAALCADCGGEAELSEKRKMKDVESEQYEGTVIIFNLSCVDCGTDGIINYTTEGVRSTDSLDLSEASYNQSESERNT